jgi:large subunit ribosomal protein L18e
VSEWSNVLGRGPSGLVPAQVRILSPAKLINHFYSILIMKRTGPTNPRLKQLVIDLKTLGGKQKVALWKRIAQDLEKPTRIRRKVNLEKVEKHLRDGETALVPGKLLSLGNLTKKAEIAAYQASTQALEKIQKAGAKFTTIEELMKNNPNGKKVRIIG